MPTPRPTNEKLQSLRIDPQRKAASRGAGGMLFLAVGLILGLGIAFAYFSLTSSSLSRNQSASPKSEAKAAAPTPATRSAQPAVPQAGSTVLTANGYVTPRRRIALSPRVMGQVSWVGIEKGDHVTAQQVLVRLKNDDYLAQKDQAAAAVASAEARLRELETGSRAEDIARARAAVRENEAALANAESVLKRREELASTSAESQQTVDNAKMTRDMTHARLEMARQELTRWQVGARKEAIDAARADLDRAKASLAFADIQVEDTVIRAPIDGTILEKLIEVGELVSPQNFGGTRGARTELLSLADLADLQVEVDINESDFAKIAMGQEGKVTLDAYPDRSYQARVREIAPEANRTKATVQIKVQILNPDKFVLPEMSARVDFLASDAKPPAAGS